MSAPAQPSGEPVTSKAQLVEYLASGSKPETSWLIGTEHEKFAFQCDDLRPLTYEGPRGIGAVLKGLEAFGWQPVEEAGHVIALVKDGASVTLEPGGQVELSGAPLATVHATCREVNEHLKQVKEIGAKLNIAFLGLGFNPKWRREDVPWMPKGRYAIMRRYMPLKGQLGLDMMLRTCTVQVNLDFSSEADMVRKFRVALALQPVATAMWANSPFVEGKPSGLLSYRSHIWTDTDPDRTGVLPFVFEEGMGFERYVDYALDVPMYFVYRDGVYIDVAGSSFRDFMAGRLAALPGQLPTMGDWVDHLTTMFPEVRLKKFLEMRGADGGPWRRLCALPAFWVGLLYDQVSLDAAWDLVKDWSIAEYSALRAEVPTTGLATAFRGRQVRDIAIEALAIAEDGLNRRARLDAYGRTEAIFLQTLHNIVQSGRTPADEMLADFEGRWAGNIDEAFREYCY
ncbi:glutamate--cysteine ligase [Telmatospirillum sp.]|uniref:glutamate--cysteine ligase n=1 Tax=Telmatospirillum sp. TaxID=2079197 RepID=UPI00283B7B41|nr:glutamate--cysteine ligase [Telmatospirillum sp.]MDR3435939.1 glutamate--cysteine ligase [Telmatospirillum sp.]